MNGPTPCNNEAGLREKVGPIANRITVVTELLKKKFGEDPDVALLRTTVAELVEIACCDPSPVKAAASLPNNHGEVLYIEDNPVNFGLVADTFRELRPSLNVQRARNGREGIDLALTSAPDLILLDLNLPDMHGSDVLDVLQQNPSSASIPVVVLSADATPYRIERLLAAGARNYLIKPFDLTQFLAVIDDIFEELAARR